MPDGLFIFFAALTIGAAALLVLSRNAVTSAMGMILALVGVAADFFLLDAYFLGVLQVLVYAGAVMVLFLFGVMLTRAKLGRETDLNNRYAGIAAPVSLLLFGVMVYVLLKGFSDDTFPATTGGGATPQSTATVSDLIFKPYLLPFWALSFVLLAAVIGAIVLARKD